MSTGKAIRGVASWILRPLRWEVVKAPRLKHARFEIGDALTRLGRHGFEVRSIIDVGASDGRWSRGAMKRYPGASALAFEPLVEHEKALEQMRQTHPRFDYVLAVAGNKRDSVRLTVTDDLYGSGIFGGADGNTRTVPMTTIDEEVERRRLPAPYLIKLDTHGFEVPILEGAARTLEEASVVIIEVYNFEFAEGVLRFHEMCTHMESLGFRPFDLIDPLLRPKDLVLWQMDLFFAPVSAPIFECSQYG